MEGAADSIRNGSEKEHCRPFPSGVISPTPPQKQDIPSARTQRPFEYLLALSNLRVEVLQAWQIQHDGT